MAVHGPVSFCCLKPGTFPSIANQ